MEEKGMQKMFVDIKYLALQIVEKRNAKFVNQYAKEIVSICEHGIYN
jgi:hypothetical protein